MPIVYGILVKSPEEVDNMGKHEQHTFTMSAYADTICPLNLPNRSKWSSEVSRY